MAFPDHQRPEPAPMARLLPPLLAVVAGILIDRYIGPLDTSTWLWIAIGLAPLAWFGAKSRWLGTTAILGAYLAFAASYHHYHWSDQDGDDLARVVDESPRPTWVRGLIGDVSGFRPGASKKDSGYTRATLRITGIYDGRSGAWKSASGWASLGIVGDRSDLRPGDAVQAAGTIARVAGPLNPGEFDYRAYLRSQGIRLRLFVDTAEGVWTDEESPTAAHSWGWRIARGVGAIRAWSQATLAKGLDARTAPLASALLLGRREGVDPNVNDAFARTGTTHLLAISGLHMQVLALVLGRALGGLGASSRASHLLVGAATFLYTVLVGFMPSVARSAAMTATYCFAGTRHRRAHPANTLALAGLATLGLNPSYLFDVGCQLSFLAVAAIVWGFDPLWQWVENERKRRLDPLDALERSLQPYWRSIPRRVGWWLAEGLAMSTVVWLAALPLAALRFHIVSPIGILLNVPLIPITSAALLASGISLGLSSVWTPLGWPFAWCNGFLLDWTEKLVLWGAALRWGHAFVPGPPWPWVLGFYLGLALLAVVLVARWPGKALAVGFVSAWVAIGFGFALVPRITARSIHDAPEAEVLAVGHGLAVMIDTGGGHGVLYDCGRMRDPSVGRRLIAPALWSRGVRRLDALILSHADADHYNGLPDLLDRIPIDAVLLPQGFDTGASNPGTAELLDEVRARGIPVKHLARGDHWDAGETRFRVLHPPRDWSRAATDNGRSLVLDVSWHDRHALLTGDLDGEGLTTFLEGAPGYPIDVLLSPHHGGRTANPSWLYDRLKPASVVVSQRTVPARTRDALAPLEAQAIAVHRTWKRGAIRLRWGDSGIVASGFLDGATGASTADDGEGRGW